VHAQTVDSILKVLIHEAMHVRMSPRARDSPQADERWPISWSSE
jgi:hypothetical protein